MNFTIAWGSGSFIDVAAKWVALFAPVLTAIGVLVAAFSYRHSVRLRRAEWLQKLYQQFYEQERYREIRELLDYRSDRDISRLHGHITAETRDVWTDRL